MALAVWLGSRKEAVVDGMVRLGNKEGPDEAAVATAEEADVLAAEEAPPECDDDKPDADEARSASEVELFLLLYHCKRGAQRHGPVSTVSFEWARRTYQKEPDAEHDNDNHGNDAADNPRRLAALGLSVAQCGLTCACKAASSAALLGGVVPTIVVVVLVALIVRGVAAVSAIAV